MKALTVFVFVFLGACASSPPKTDLEKVFKRISDSDYQDIIDDKTHNDRRYKGFHNTYQVSATLIDTKVQNALLQREGYYMQWEPTLAREKRETRQQEMSSSTYAFISLFTPKTDHNDLHKGASMWKVYLEVDGLRYKGKIKTFEKNLAQIKHLYPYHSRFSKAYTARFEIPTQAVETKDAVLILTSSLGTTTFEYR